MKYKEVEADIFTFQGPRIICHGVNCQKKMNSGIAKTIREKWPKNYDTYMLHEPKLGEVLFYREEDVIIANCYTQEFYGYDNRKYASYTAVSKSIHHVLTMADRLKVPVYMPLIGCGLGGLRWEVLQEVIKDLAAFEAFPNTSLTVCLPPAGVGHIGQKAKIV